MSNDDTQLTRTSPFNSFENFLVRLGESTEVMMDVLELLTALIMVGLFAIGVYDLGLKMYLMITSGAYTDPNAVIKLIDTALLLMIIVEIYRTVIAYVEDLNILPIVLNVAIIAMARKIISFRTAKYATPHDALLSALSYGVLLVIVISSFYLIHRIQQDTSFNIFSAGETETDS
jgi:uncharacterized membrane protein (DUF373 family)